MELPEHVLETATQQSGLVTRAQLIAGGVPAAMIRWQMGRRWRSVLPGVIQLDSGLPSFQQRMMAALLAAGPDSWLSGVTAAGWHGMPVWDHRLPIFVMVPAPARSRRIAWVSIRATTLTNERSSSAAGCGSPAARVRSSTPLPRRRTTLRPER